MKLSKRIIAAAVGLATVTAPLTGIIGNISPAMASSTLTDFGGGYDGFILNDDEGEYISISHYEGDETDIVIPEEFDGIPVKELDAYAFAHIKKTESIVIPSGVKDINLLFHGRTPNLRNIEFKGRDISIILTFDKYNIGQHRTVAKMR